MKVLLAEVNASEGRNLGLIGEMKSALMEGAALRILEINSDKDHSRTVFTYSGEPDEVLEGTQRLAKKAVEMIDMTMHTGAHPRMGTVDAVPFIPARNATQEEAIEASKAFGAFLGRLDVPVYYYKEAATKPERKSLGMSDAASMNPFRKK